MPKPHSVDVAPLPTAHDLAKAIGVSPVSIYRWVKAGTIDAVVLGPKTIRIPWSTFRRLTGTE